MSTTNVGFSAYASQCPSPHYCPLNSSPNINLSPQSPSTISSPKRHVLVPRTPHLYSPLSTAYFFPLPHHYDLLFIFPSSSKYHPHHAPSPSLLHFSSFFSSSWPLHHTVITEADDHGPTTTSATTHKTLYWKLAEKKKFGVRQLRRVEAGRMGWWWGGGRWEEGLPWVRRDEGEEG